MIRHLVTPNRTTLLLAFLAVYVIWGSTYLGIRYVVETVPPLISAGVRFIIAGGLIYAFVRRTDPAAPTRVHWRAAVIVAALLLLGGNGLVVLASHVVPSALTALIIAATSFWMVLLDWLIFRGPRPTLAVAMGLLLGFAGIAVLNGSELTDLSGHAMSWAWLLVPLAASLSWSVGSLYAKRAPQPSNAMLNTGMQMLCGGGLLMLMSAIIGEWSHFDVAAISARSWIAWIYLTIFGSMLGFTSYVYVLKHSTPAAASTYAFVNPLVAVALGSLTGEPISHWVILAAGLIVGAVVLITLGRPRKTQMREEPAASIDAPVQSEKMLET